MLSDVTAAEVQDAPEAVRDLHQELLALVEGVLPLTEEALSLVAAYEARKILTPKYLGRQPKPAIDRHLKTGHHA